MTSSRRASARCCPDARASRSATSTRLEAELRSKDVAAFIVEPIQGRLVTLPPAEYLRAAQDLCRRYGTLFVADEIQTGLGRTGSWFALERWGLEPDIVLVGKALSGGYMPVAAMVTRRDIYQRAVGTLERSYVHQSTYGRNRLSMAAGLATLRVIERDRLVERAAQMGTLLTDGLGELRQRHELVKEVRGAGLMIGIELQAPRSRKGQMGVRLMRMASEGLFPQLVVIPLHRDHGVITMAAGKNDVIKLLPPLTVSGTEVRTFLGALDAVLTECESDSGKNWAVVRDIATSTMRRRERETAPAPMETPFRGRRIDRSRDDVCLVTGATGFIGSHLAERLVRDGYQVRCLVRPTSDTTSLDGLDVELATGDLTSARLARARRRGLPLRVPLRRDGVRLGHSQGGVPCQRRGHAGAAERLRCRLGEARRALLEHRRVRLSRWRGDRRDIRCHQLPQLVRADQTAGGGRGPPVRGDARPRRGHPAALDRVWAALQRGGPGDRPRDPGRSHDAD